MELKRLTYSVVFLIGVGFLLVKGKAILLPIMIAFLMYFLIRSIRRLSDKNVYIRTRFPSWLKNSIAASALFLIISLLINSIYIQILELAKSWVHYKKNSDVILKQLTDHFQINLSLELQKNMMKFDFSEFINPILDSITSFTGNLVIILFYLLFLIIEETNYKRKIGLLFLDKKNLNQSKLLLNNIEKSITNYLGLKTFICFISATCCFISLYFIGLHFPFLWALLIFTLNYIPVVGPFLAVSLPFLFAIIQYIDLQYPGIILLILIIIQLLISNVVEPKIMGSSLNISPLVALISLAVWGSMWGIIGMIVSVPITVILIILLAHFPHTHKIAVLLSNKGDV